MKYILFISYLLVFNSAVIYSQNNQSGTYHNYFGSTLTINPNGSYEYSYKFDLATSWSSGKWFNIKDTIYLINVPIYDTVYYEQESPLGIIKCEKKILLSADNKPEIITAEEAVFIGISSLGQNRFPHPQKFYLKVGKLYEVNDKGHLKRKRLRGFYTKKKYPAYYVKE